jgi:hypothetical protein
MTNHEGKPILDPDELKAEFAALFPLGWCGPDVMAEIAPEGWANSPLKDAFHPSVEQVYEESLRMHRNLASFGGREPKSSTPEPTLEEIKASHEDGPIDPARECQELVGQCLWDVFSDNHEVFADDGRLLDLGSQRASGGVLAEIVNEQGGPRPLPRPDSSAFFEEMFARSTDGSPEATKFMAELRKEMFGDGGYTYLDYYLGTKMIADRADLTPVYQMIFRRLHRRGMDWTYHFPRLFVADLRPLKKMLDEKERGDEPEFAGYDPSAAFAEDQEERQHDTELAELRESLDEDYRQAVEAARDAEPPTIVKAFAAVYGTFPNGWPPDA